MRFPLDQMRGGEAPVPSPELTLVKTDKEILEDKIKSQIGRLSAIRQRIAQFTGENGKLKAPDIPSQAAETLKVFVELKRMESEAETELNKLKAERDSHLEERFGQTAANDGTESEKTEKAA